MKLDQLSKSCEPGTSKGSPANEHAFTLVEVLIVMGLIGLLMISGMGALFSMDLCSRRTADYNAALAVVEAKIEDIRAATYNPPNGTNFNSTTVWLTNSDSIALDKAGVTFKVPGTLVSKIEPMASGHLVTVTGTFQEPRLVLTVSLQTVVNKYSGGQQ
jgi:prepilin-type N-terminal cleavage/methylation domain-containing protein